MNIILTYDYVYEYKNPIVLAKLDSKLILKGVITNQYEKTQPDASVTITIYKANSKTIFFSKRLVSGS